VARRAEAAQPFNLFGREHREHLRAPRMFANAGVFIADIASHGAAFGGRALAGFRFRNA
jgi:hypothetical protein